MVSTSDMRAAWGPACNGGSMTTIDFGDNGARVTVAKATVPVWRAVEAIFAKHGYGIRQADTGAYDCRAITGGTDYSLHAYGIAVDVNWQSNPYGSTLVTDMPPGAIRDIEALEVDGVPVIRWGGRYSGNKDAMHFEVIVPPATASRFQSQEDDIVTEEQMQRLENVAQNQGKLTRKLVATLFEREKGRDQRSTAEILEAIEGEG